MSNWRRPFVSSSSGQRWHAHTSAIPVACDEWDRANAGRLLRILTVNMHGRPVDILRTKSNDGDDTGTPGSKLAAYQECDDEYHLANAQDRRMRGFFEWLDLLEPHVLPHVICFQEVIWRNMLDIAVSELRARGWVTHDSISLDEDRGCSTCFPPRVGSGLGIYVRRDAGLSVVDGGRFVFDLRLGADWLVDKGFKWGLVRIRNPQLLGCSSAQDGEGYAVVLTMHPQAYNSLKHVPPPGEPWYTRFLRFLASLDFEWRGGFPGAITAAHRAQYEQIASYVRGELLPKVASSIGRARLRGVFVAADLNVNRYAAEPETDKEANPVTAFTPGEESGEFRAVRETLGCAKVPLILQEPDPRLRAPNGGRFTWDGHFNSIAKPLTRRTKPAFAWIDSVLACFSDDPNAGAHGAVKYIDNRSIALRLPRAIPEIAPFWTSRCFEWRRRRCANTSEHAAYRDVNREILLRLNRGRRQLLLLRHLFRQSLTAIENVGAISRAELRRMWQAFVLKAPYQISSQVWKGAQFYGLKFTDLHVKRETSHLRIGDPHPFRMLADVTDHHAVLSRIIL